jgi:tetratricopeptide (TPR) repeat protein
MENNDFNNMEGSQQDDFLSDLLSRFEQMLSGKQTGFFDADELLELIDYYMMSGQMSLAKRALEMAVSQFPDNKDVTIYHYRYLHASGRTSLSIEKLKDFVSKNPENTEALMSLGEILTDAGKQSEAIEYLEAALQLADEQEKPLVMQQIIDTLDDVGQHYKMIPYLKEMIRIHPDNSESMSSLAYCYNILNREEEGIVYFSKLADRDAFNTYAWFNLGALYFGVNLFEKAIEAFDFVLAIEPRFTTAAIKKGSALTALERIESAIEVYLEVLEYEKKDASIYTYLGHCFMQKKDHHKSVFYFNKAIELDAEATEAQLGLTYAYAGLDQFTLALNHMENVIEVFDDVAELWFYKAYLEEQIDCYQWAIDSYRSGLKIDETDIDAWLALSGMYTEYFDDYSEALSVLEDAISLNSGNPELLYRAASICFEVGLDNEGSNNLHKALTIDKQKVELMFSYNPLLETHSTVVAILNLYL